MNPDNQHHHTPAPRGQVTPPQRSVSDAHTSAVANMTREQINAIYGQQAAAEAANTHDQHSVYERTETVTHATHDDWTKYHSAWRDYYQKYYETYYVGAVQQAHDTYQKHAEAMREHTAQALGKVQTSTVPEREQVMSEDEALYDLRQQLVSKVQKQAGKVRKSRHFMPAVSAMAVLVIFVFLQYNTTIIGYAKAYVTPGSAESQAIVVDPLASTSVGKESKLIIPKLSLNVPVIYDTTPKHDDQMAAMAKGVAYFGIPGANAKPGQRGNVPIAGHSSNEFYDNGRYKFIFARLDQMKKSDVFYLNYKGTRYTYSVSHVRVVMPNEVDKLVIGDDKPYATLITCTPLGTAAKRLLVFGEQISPDPKTASANDTNDAPDAAPVTLTGKEPTLFERLFGAE